MIDDRNGLLVNPADESALTSAMEQAYLQAQAWNKANIAAEAAAKYNPSAVAAALEKSYRSLIDPCVE